MNQQAPVVIEREHLDPLLQAIAARGYRLIGPVVRHDGIHYEEFAETEKLPVGYVDIQQNGRYRLEKTDSSALFNFTTSQNSWKQFLFPPEVKLFEARKSDHGFEVTRLGEQVKSAALIGVRACELAAINIHDRILAYGSHPDHDYVARREDCFVVAVNCTRAGGTCFCASMGTGPKVSDGFDLALTEIIDEQGHRFIVKIGSPAGAQIISSITSRAATAEELAEGEKLIEHAGQQMGRTFATEGLKEAIAGSFESPHWEKIANRCLACGNCTLVCPTCFCTRIEESTGLTGQTATRTRKWDHCFNLDHSYIHGGSVRRSISSRYRQWLSHKLCNWVDQFGTFGCVGCGRCITWCPVGIDLRQEATALMIEYSKRSKVTAGVGRG